MISNHRPIPSNHTYLRATLLLLALFLVGLGITIDSAQAAPFPKMPGLGKFVGKSERTFAERRLGNPKPESEPFRAPKEEPLPGYRAEELERLPDGRFRLPALIDKRSRPIAKSFYTRTRDAVPDESVSLIMRDSHGRFTEVTPTMITGDKNLENIRKRHADSTIDFLSTVLYKAHERRMPMTDWELSQKLYKNTTLQSSQMNESSILKALKELKKEAVPRPFGETYSPKMTAEAIKEFTKSQDFKNELSVGGSINEGISKVADIRSVELYSGPQFSDNHLRW